MNDVKIKISTIARIGALLVALTNQVLAIFGQDLLPFTENTAYQIISFAFTVVIVVINAWYNNDVTRLAILSGKVFDAMNDGKITEEEIEHMLESLNSTTSEEESAVKNNFFVKTINKIITAIKPKSNK